MLKTRRSVEHGTRALSKLTENMKYLSKEDRELIRRARRDGRGARGNEERKPLFLQVV